MTPATAPHETRLIVRGDDMGVSPACDEAAIRCYRDGIMTSVEVLVTGPWFLHSARLLKENPRLDVGVHLALTSEWDLLKWRPLSHCPSLLDPDGYFFPMLMPEPNYPGQSVTENAWTLADVEKEFRRQIEVGLKHIPHASHVTGHMGCTTFAPEVADVVRRLAHEFGLAAGVHETGLRPVRYAGPHRTLADKKTSFLAALDTLVAGETHLFVDHPGVDCDEVRALYTRSYLDVAVDRQGVTDLWTDPEIKEAIRARGIRLIRYADLA